MRLKGIVVGFASVCFAGAISLACGSSGNDKSDGGGGVPGLEAAAATIGFPPACETCIGANCASQFETCWADSACMNIEICTGECIEKEGKTPSTCSTEDCASDSGTVASLNECIVDLCPNQCGG
jgi:hypothetical protein